MINDGHFAKLKEKQTRNTSKYDIYGPVMYNFTPKVFICDDYNLVQKYIFLYKQPPYFWYLTFFPGIICARWGFYTCMWNIG